MTSAVLADSGANKGFWRFQLRDRRSKRFIPMGGGVIFETTIPGVDGIVRARGFFRGMIDLETAKIEVMDNSEIPRGIYYVKSEFIEADNSKARLSEDFLEKKLGTPEGTPAPAAPSQLKTSITGDEALKIRLKSVARSLKQKGRFPLPRYTLNNEVGKTSDTAEGAKLDYKKVFDSSPEVQELFGSSDELWDYVARTGTDLDTQSPNDLSEISKEMKVVNRAYAQHILGMEPDGLLTVYRNATNGKFTEAESAVGYVSLDRQMAYDYNSQKPQSGSDGRYEIDVKPDEVVGHIGYSRVEDEYGLAIGRGVTEQEGRVRRVGDIAMPVLPDWLEEWNKNFPRGIGESPFRKFGVAASYEFHEVEDFGSTAQEFFQKYGLEAADIGKKFDELYGEGSYEKYKESGNVINFNKLKSVFVTLDNGNIGINAEELDKLAGLKDSSEYVGDLFDNTMKMLSVFQELTGQYFMTHKTRDYTPPESVQPATPQNADIFLEVAAKQSEINIPNNYLESVIKYTDGSGMYSLVNEYLRNGPQDWMDSDKLTDAMQTVEDLESIFDELSPIEMEMEVYRGFSENALEQLSSLKEGDTITDLGFVSTSADRSVAEGFAMEDGIVAKINLPVGAKAFNPVTYRTGDPSGDPEKEMLLPPGTTLKLVSKSDEEYVFDLVLDESSETMYDEFFDAGMIDLRALRQSGSKVDAYDSEMFSYDQLQALEWYGQAGHKVINKILRSGDPISEEDQGSIDAIDEAIEENGDLFSSGRVFRGDSPSPYSEYYKFLQGLTEGKTVNFPGYFSTSNDATIAFSEFGPGTSDNDEDASLGDGSSAFFWTVDIPKNGKAMGMPEGVGFGQGVESEVLLPRNTKMKIIGIKKVEQIDDEGQSTGEFNYFIHAEQLVSAEVEPARDTAETRDSTATIYEEVDYDDVPTLKPLTEAEAESLKYYTGDGDYVQDVGHHKINTWLREGEWYYGVKTPEEQSAILKNIDNLQRVVNSGVIDKDIKVYRYQNSVLEGLDSVGEVWTSDGFLSASAATSDGKEVVTAFTYSPVVLELNIPKGSRGGAVSGSVEAEVLLPPGSKFIVQSVEKNEFGGKTISLLLVDQGSGPKEESDVEPTSKTYSSPEDLVADYETILAKIEELTDPSKSKVENGNIPMRALLELTGKGGKPQIVSAIEQLDGGDIIYRGTTDENAENFINGDSDRIGLGHNGDGYYFTNVGRTAVEYAGEGSLLRGGWKKDAKVQRFTNPETALEDYKVASSEVSKKWAKKLKMLDGEPSEAEQEIFDNYAFYDVDAYITDLILQGFDGVEIAQPYGDEVFVIVFNREALKIVDQ